MSYRKTVFANNEIYHVLNRSIAKTPLFQIKKDYLRFLETINFYRNKNIPLRFSYFLRLPNENRERIIDNMKKNNKYLVEIISFCLMDNHIHFLLKQLEDNGISIFMSKMQNSYAKYFDTIHKRKGSLFQAMFKAIRIETDEQLMHVSRYIHLNPSTAYLCKIKDLKQYLWSSFPHYLEINKFDFVSPNLVLGLFKDIKTYEKFVFDRADYQRQLSDIKHLILDS